MRIVIQDRKSRLEQQTMTFEGLLPERRHDVVLGTGRRGNSESLYIMADHQWRTPMCKPMCTRETVKRTATPPVIKNVNEVEQVERTAKHDERERYFRTVTPGGRLNQFLQHKLVLNFLAATNEWHIGLGANTSRGGHIPGSAMQALLDPGSNRSNLSNNIMIMNRQREATFAHSRKPSRIQVITCSCMYRVMRKGRESQNSELQVRGSLEENKAIIEARQCRIQKGKKNYKRRHG